MDDQPPGYHPTTEQLDEYSREPAEGDQEAQLSLRPRSQAAGLRTVPSNSNPYHYVDADPNISFHSGPRSVRQSHSLFDWDGPLDFDTPAGARQALDSQLPSTHLYAVTPTLSISRPDPASQPSYPAHYPARYLEQDDLTNTQGNFGGGPYAPTQPRYMPEWEPLAPRQHRNPTSDHCRYSVSDHATLLTPVFTHHDLPIDTDISTPRTHSYQYLSLRPRPASLAPPPTPASTMMAAGANPTNASSTTAPTKSRKRARGEGVDDEDDEDDDDSTQPPRETRKRTGRSCDNCHIQHQPCDGAQPRCGKCVAYNVECTRARRPRAKLGQGRGPPAGYKRHAEEAREALVGERILGAAIRADPSVETHILAAVERLRPDGRSFRRHLGDPNSSRELAEIFRISRLGLLIPPGGGGGGGGAADAAAAAGTAAAAPGGEDGADEGVLERTKE